MLKTREYIAVLTAMKTAGLALSLARSFSEDQLQACCDRLNAAELSVGSCREYGKLQSALVENPDSIGCIRQLFDANISGFTIEEWLKAEAQTGCRLLDHPVSELVSLFRCSFPSMQARQEYALYFMPEYADENARNNIIANIREFYMRMRRTVTGMSAEERAVFTHAFLPEYLSAVEPDVFIPRLAGNPNLLNLMDFLYGESVDLSLSGSGFERLGGLTEDMFLKLVQIYDKLGSSPERMDRFLMIWLDNGGTAGDLDTFFRKVHGMTAEQQDAALETRLSYLSALYGSSVGNIPFREVAGYAFPLVAYAITRRQNAFLRLIESNFELFRRLPYNNMLFDEEFYTRIRLNSITLKNLKECEGYINDRKGNPLNHLAKREYTFDELKTLFKARRIYAAFYNCLRIERTDERLLTLRQMLKRELLDSLVSDQVEAVAVRLSEKPFMEWKDSVFAHIAGLTPKQCVRLLYAYDSVKRFLPEIHTANEAAFLIRHSDKLETFSDWNAVKKSIDQIDTAWEKLRRELQLDDAFVCEYEQEILNFLYQEGASIAMAYMNGVMEVEGFKRILRALLMGRYAELKYHADDLVREIGFPVTDAQKAVWMSNLSDSHGRLLAEERDDFFTIMRIGELPQRTCLNYADGAYRECLLSCFDSNKKFLYATINGRPVARAMLRLTKGSAKKPGDKDTASLQFVDVFNEREVPVERDVEKLVLFLERCYVSGISMEETEEVKRMFIELAMRKAREIGAEVVLSNQYRDNSASMGFTAMQHYLYISKSKGGKQYLDSLGGSCNVTNEGSYRKEMVMMLAGEGGKA